MSRAGMLVAVFLFGGCATYSRTGQPSEAELVDVKAALVRRPATGALVVQTETVPCLDGDVDRYRHLPYDILDKGGRLVRHVPNHEATWDEHPAVVRLPPGEYFIRAQTNGSRQLCFRVFLRPNRTTEIDLARLER